MDYSQYHPDWKDVIRPMILKRDNYKCRVCGIGHKKEVYKLSNGLYREVDSFLKQWCVVNNFKVFTLYLQIAHLDHNKQNNEPDNLMSLCPYHHANYDREHKKFTRITFRKKIETSKSKNDGKTKNPISEPVRELQQFIKETTGHSIAFNDALHIYEKCISIIKNQ
jgi:5-methylcytosine-specific restriction endonuclease McrA